MRKPAALAASKASPSKTSLVAVPAYWICLALMIALVALACRIAVVL